MSGRGEGRQKSTMFTASGVSIGSFQPDVTYAFGEALKADNQPVHRFSVSGAFRCHVRVLSFAPHH